MNHTKIVDADVREFWAASYLADGPDAWRARLQVVVDLDAAPPIEPHACDVQSNARGIRGASRRDQDVAAFQEPLALRRPHAETQTLSGPPLDLERLGRKENLDPFVAEELPDGLRDVGVLPFGQLRPVLDHRHPAAETAVSLCEFKADVAAAEHDQVRRQAVAQAYKTGDLALWREDGRCPTIGAAHEAHPNEHLQ